MLLLLRPHRIIPDEWVEQDSIIKYQREHIFESPSYENCTRRIEPTFPSARML